MRVRAKAEKHVEVEVDVSRDRGIFTFTGLGTWGSRQCEPEFPMQWGSRWHVDPTAIYFSWAIVQITS